MSRYDFNHLFQNDDDKNLLYDENLIEDETHESPVYHNFKDNDFLPNSVKESELLSPETPFQSDENSEESHLNTIGLDSMNTQKLVPIDSVPPHFRSLFPFPSFNYVQSTVFDSVYKGDENIVVEAPTGSGKTVLLELAILRILESNELFSKTSEHSSSNNGKVIVYIAPTKVLICFAFLFYIFILIFYIVLLD